jgi:hypothetical protein
VNAISPSRLEVVRIVREHCAGIVDHPLPESRLGDAAVSELAYAALDMPIEVMAGWVQLDETVMANIRLVMSMVRERLVGPTR